MMETITQYNEHLSIFHSLVFMPLHNWTLCDSYPRLIGLHASATKHNGVGHAILRSTFIARWKNEWKCYLSSDAYSFLEMPLGNADNIYKILLILSQKLVGWFLLCFDIKKLSTQIINEVFENDYQVQFKRNTFIYSMARWYWTYEVVFTRSNIICVISSCLYYVYLQTQSMRTV